LIAKAQAYAEAQLAHIQQEAQQKMQQQLQAQIDRLQALAKINPSVRPEEVAHLQTMKSQLADYICKARLKFDAIRVIVVSHE
jgi:ATP-dependent helicase HepA